MDRRAKYTPVDIDHEPLGSKELREDLVKIGALADVPQRLGMVHGDNAVEPRLAAVPCRAVSEVGANERGNVTNCLTGEARRNNIPYHHVAFGSELLPVLAGDPTTGEKRESHCLQVWRSDERYYPKTQRGSFSTTGVDVGSR
jgi:hypothetical protein